MKNGRRTVRSSGSMEQMEVRVLLSAVSDCISPAVPESIRSNGSDAIPKKQTADENLAQYRHLTDHQLLCRATNTMSLGLASHQVAMATLNSVQASLLPGYQGTIHLPGRLTGKFSFGIQYGTSASFTGRAIVDAPGGGIVRYVGSVNGRGIVLSWGDKFSVQGSLHGKLSGDGTTIRGTLHNRDHAGGGQFRVHVVLTGQ